MAYHIFGLSIIICALIILIMYMYNIISMLIKVWYLCSIYASILSINDNYYLCLIRIMYMCMLYDICTNVCMYVCMYTCMYLSIYNNYYLCLILVVVNVTLPDDKQNYVHRIGRVGRADRMGLAISLVATVKEKVCLLVAMVISVTMATILYSVCMY